MKLYEITEPRLLERGGCCNPLTPFGSGPDVCTSNRHVSRVPDRLTLVHIGGSLVPVHLLLWILRANGIRKISCKWDPSRVLIPTASTSSSITMQRLYAYSSLAVVWPRSLRRREGRHLHNAFHCAKCTETDHRSLSNYSCKL